MKKHERKEEVDKVEVTEVSEKKPFSHKLKWLSNLLWGGSALLAFEHLWHGEIVPWYPFLTAASDPADAMEMLHEMATVGSSMAVVVTLAWVGMVVISNVLERRAATHDSKINEKKEEIT